jgi:hypothetical protein
MFQRHYQVRAGSEPPAAGPSDVRQEDFRHMKDDFQGRQQFRFSRTGMVHILANFFLMWEKFSHYRLSLLLLDLYQPKKRKKEK